MGTELRALTNEQVECWDYDPASADFKSDPNKYAYTANGTTIKKVLAPNTKLKGSGGVAKSACLAAPEMVRKAWGWSVFGGTGTHATIRMRYAPQHKCFVWVNDVR